MFQTYSKFLFSNVNKHKIAKYNVNHFTIESMCQKELNIEMDYSGQTGSDSILWWD